MNATAYYILDDSYFKLIDEDSKSNAARQQLSEIKKYTIVSIILMVISRLISIAVGNFMYLSSLLMVAGITILATNIIWGTQYIKNKSTFHVGRKILSALREYAKQYMRLRISDNGINCSSYDQI
jgi:hypothetical protein